VCILKLKGMEYSYDLDFDLLIDDLSKDITSGEEFSSSSSVGSSPIYTICNVDSPTSRRQKAKKTLECDDNSSIESEAQLGKLRILRSDIRRSYANMFLNVISSGDFSLLYGFIDTFCTPNAENVFIRPNCQDVFKDQYLTFKQRGVYDMARYWYASALMKPDAVVSMKECNIHTPFNSTVSTVVSLFRFTATLLLEDMPADYGNPNPTVLKVYGPEESLIGHKRRIDAEQQERASTMKNIMASVDNMVSRLSLRSDPISIDADVILTMYLDENKRVTKMVMNCAPNRYSITV